MLTDPNAATITEVTVALRNGSLTAVDLMATTIQRLEATEPHLHAFASWERDRALAHAAAADQRQRRGEPLGPLHGIPVGIKDLIDVVGFPTEAGSAVLAGNRPAVDAAVVRRLRDAGAIIVGKHRTHEFGFGLDAPPTRSPWNAHRYPGGSTVGGAASVAAGSSLAAIGTDGGGSIRKPAAINGLVGFKPTFGQVSTDGLVPGATSLDHIGWITRSVDDAALLLEVLAGSQRRPGISPELTGLRIGCPTYLFADLEPDIERTVTAVLERLTGAGVAIVPLEIPELVQTPSIHATVGAAEAFHLHHRLFRSRPEAYHPKIRSYLLAASEVTADDLTAARRGRAGLIEAMEGAFARHQLDVICSPTLPIAPVPLVEMDPEILLPQYCRFTAPLNVTGQPALSIPCGHGPEGMPRGFQLAARRGDDHSLLGIGRILETMVRGPQAPTFAWLSPTAGSGN